MKTRPNPFILLLNHRLAFVVLFTTALFTSNSAQALTYDWSGATSGNIGTPAAWGGTTPTGTDIARWNATTYTNAPTVNANITFGQLLFDAGNTNGVTFGTGTSTLTLNGISGVGIQLNNGSGAVTTGSAKFALGAAQAWTNDSGSLLTVGGTIANGGFNLTLNGSGNTTLGGIISGTGGIVKSGAGILTLNGANTFTTGGVSLSAGTLSLGNNAALGAATSVLTIAGGTIDVTAARTTTNNNAQNWNGDFTFTGTNTWSTGTGAVTLGGGNRQVTVSASTMTVGGAIGDGGNTYGLTKAGAGALVLSGVNTYTGATTISGGTLSAGTTANLGAAASNLILDGGTLQITGTALTSVSGIGHTVITNSGKTVGLDINNSANTFTFDQVLNQGTGGLTKLGTGTLVLNQANAYSGATTIGTGTVSVATVGNSGASSNLGSNGTINFGATTTGGTLTYTGIGETSDKVINLAGTTGGATITQSGTGLLKFTSNLTAAGSGAKTLTFTGSTAGTGEISGNIVDSGGGATGVLKNGSGTWTLSGANTYSGLTSLQGSSGNVIFSGSNSSAGATTAQSGTMTLNSASNGGLASGLITLGSGASIQVATAATLSNTVTLGTGSGGLNVNGAQNLTFNGDITFVNQTSKGLINNLTGGAALTFNGSFLNLSAPTTNTYLNSGSGNTVINSVIQTVGGGGPGSLTNSGTLTLAGANTYAGGTTLTTGTLRINNGGSSSSNSAIGTGLLTITAGTIDNTSGGAITLATNNAQTWNSNFTFTGSNDLNLGTGAVSLGTTTGTTRTVTTTAGNLTVGGAISNGTTAFGLIKAGAGQLTLSAANTYIGATTIQNGTLSVSSLNSVSGGTASSSLGAPVTSVNGTIGLGSSSTTANLKVVGTGETTDRVINLAGTTGGGTIEQAGTGLLKFTSSFTATGGGIKTLTLTGSTAGTGEIAGAIVDNSPTNKTSLTKDGTGAWTLSGANSYTGTTTVNAGKLTITPTGTINSTSGISIGAGEFNYNNSTTALSKSISFSGTGGTLSGTGTITPAVTITSDNRQTAGSSVTAANPTAVLGTEIFSNGITYNSGSIFEWNLTANDASTEGTRGTDYDAVNTANLGATSGAIFRVILNGSQNFGESFWDTDRTWAGVFQNLAESSAHNLSTVFNGGFQYQNSAGTVAGVTDVQGSFSFTDGGTGLKWTSFTAVPEPSSAIAGLLLAAGLFRRRRA